MAAKHDSVQPAFYIFLSVSPPLAIHHNGSSLRVTSAGYTLFTQYAAQGMGVRGLGKLEVDALYTGKMIAIQG